MAAVAGRCKTSGNEIGFDKKIVERFRKIWVSEYGVVKNGVRQFTHHR
jgi:hypothetical protein